jgi:hypothetical protein
LSASTELAKSASDSTCGIWLSASTEFAKVGTKAAATVSAMGWHICKSTSSICYFAMAFTSVDIVPDCSCACCVTICSADWLAEPTSKIIGIVELKWIDKDRHDHFGIV